MKCHLMGVSENIYFRCQRLIQIQLIVIYNTKCSILGSLKLLSICKSTRT